MLGPGWFKCHSERAEEHTPPDQPETGVFARPLTTPILESGSREVAMVKRSKPLVVTVSDEKLADIRGVAEKLAAKGMKIERVMPITGVITGSYSGNVSAMQKVNAVASVEEEKVAYLPPSESRLQ